MGQQNQEMPMKTRRLPAAGHDIFTSLLGHGIHCEIGRLLPPNDAAHGPISTGVKQRGEQLWYTPGNNPVRIRGLMVKLNESEQKALGDVRPAATAAVHWAALDSEGSETDSALQVLTEEQHRYIRTYTPSTVIADIVAAVDREKTGQRRGCESITDTAKRLAKLVQG